MKRSAVIMLIAAAAAARADSGLVRLSETCGPWKVTVMTDPTPVRQGPIDIAVMVQDAHSGAPELEVSVELTLLHVDSGTRVKTAATRPQADNRLLHAAKFILPSAGAWEVHTDVASETTEASVAWSFSAAEALPPFASAWPWLLPVPAALVLYGVNRRLHAGRSASTS
ncbi:MAG: hypothetical protein QF561_00930 [Phycisphaerales bacterium]|jgi:hypothetical protein|nr:hypothetical protein [Phycisphaerales bacterium]